MARLAAAAALVKVSPDEAKGAIQCIIELLRAEDVQVRYAALSALQSLAVRDGDIGWNPYTPHDPSSTFGNMGAEVIAAVTASLKDGDGRIREAAALALASIGPEAKDSAVVVEELFKDNEGRVRRAAAMAVGAMGPDVGRTIPALKGLLKDRDGRVREAAAQSLEKIEPQASQGTAELTRNRDVGRYVAIQVLEQPDSDARAAVSAVARLLKADDWFLRVEAASFLGEIGPDAKATAPGSSNCSRTRMGRFAAPLRWLSGKSAPTPSNAFTSSASCWATGTERSDRPPPSRLVRSRAQKPRRPFRPSRNCWKTGTRRFAMRHRKPWAGSTNFSDTFGDAIRNSEPVRLWFPVPAFRDQDDVDEESKVRNSAPGPFMAFSAAGGIRPGIHAGLAGREPPFSRSPQPSSPVHGASSRRGLQPNGNLAGLKPSPREGP